MSVRPLPPSPPAGFAGHLPAFRSDRLGFLTHCAREYGDMVFWRFGPTAVYVVSHPDLVEQVLVTHHRSFIKGEGSGNSVLRGLVGEGLVTSEGEFWKRQRRLMQPAFHRERVGGYARTMVQRTQKMLSGWRDGEVRDVHADMMALTLDIALQTLFSADVSGAAAAVGPALTVALGHVQDRLSSPVLYYIPDWVPLPANLRFQRAVRRLEEVVYDVIRHRRGHAGDGEHDLLAMLLAARDEDGTAMTERQLRDEILTLMIAGHETTASTLAWCFHLLDRHPGAAQRLQTELAGALHGRPPEVNDLAALPYTQQVVNEALRLYPPGWILGREVAAECEIGGYRLPKGALVFAAPWVVQRDARWFPEPDRFDPDRWANGMAGRIPKYAYFPFGGGPRMCIGYQFAQTEAALVLATVAQRFRLRAAPGPEPKPEPLFTLRPRGGVRMAIETISTGRTSAVGAE